MISNPCQEKNERIPYFYSKKVADNCNSATGAEFTQIFPPYIALTPLTSTICGDISATMVKQYPLRVDNLLWRRAKAKAAMADVSLREALQQLIEGWVEGKICILADVRSGFSSDGHSSKIVMSEKA